MSYPIPSYDSMPDFSKVFEAWDQPSFVSRDGWIYTPAVGTFGDGPSSHFTYRPDGTLDHYSFYDGMTKLGGFKFNP
jgi:hypothetical protein